MLLIQHFRIYLVYFQTHLSSTLELNQEHARKVLTECHTSTDLDKYECFSSSLDSKYSELRHILDMVVLF